MFKLFFTLILSFLNVCCYVSENSISGTGLTQAILYSGRIVGEMSPGELEKILNTIPPLDHVILFYINLNQDCRDFFPLYSQLYYDLLSEGWKLKFVKFNCQGVDKRLKMCRDYNINVVPTIAYISSYPLQRWNIPEKSYLRKLLRFLLHDHQSDILLQNATKYRGDIFAYDQLRDWVLLMYNISSLNRRIGTRESMIKFLKDTWNSFITFFKK
ncbi:hypothetical protein TpMuguga_04g00254 [Theileria parva strain Muguga]|uniref:uncharacterized protein n=1 Tax=Theileria parva strain Muguga TaxID=333668 RepID=UPI001C61CC02|nr:uncharacterized protein TpMuguga_04g00254 [Theileria parva strain Muguga]EAN31606.2 hypothetical protein TpMuguga_04g00254 [Theileria parva strain Muguga]